VADTLDVLSISEAKDAINLEQANVDHDDEIARQVTAVSRIFDATVGPVVQRTITDELHDGGGCEVNLRFWPASSVTTVTEYSSGSAQVLVAETVSSLPANGYLAESYTRAPSLLSGRLIRRSSGSDYPFPTGRRNVKVTYVAGRYATTAVVDARFKECAASVLRRLWKREAETWAQSRDFFEQIDPQSGVQLGFFRVAKPIIDEMLADEVQVLHVSGFG
jgi:hypothetical protein